jgi:hypothetical protein
MPKEPSGMLYNHSKRKTVSHQIASSSGSTSSGRRHATYNTSSIDVTSPAPDPGDEMDIDHPLDDSNIIPDNSPIQTDVELPGLTVTAKQRAKRYANSVNSPPSTLCLFLCEVYRIFPSTPGSNIAMNILMSVWF